MDEEGKSLNDQQYFGQDAFFTNGGSMGVLWLQYVKDSEKEHQPMSREEYFPYFHMALFRAGMKNNPEDESYLDIGSGRGTDYYMKWYKYEDMVSAHTHEIYSSWELDTKLDKNQDIDMPDGSNKQSAQIIGLRPWANKQDAKGWSFYNSGRNFVVADGWVLPVQAAMDNSGQSGVESEAKEAIKKGGDSYYYELYVGTPYVFAAIKGEGGNDTSGRGSTLTIKKNQLKIVKEGNYSKPDGTSGKSDGVVLPETSKIVIEEGGVLSVEGNFINNGTIENNGGTIIIKDGGCISPFGNTDEGTIKNVGGTVIVMPKGRLFCLVDDLEKTRPAPPLSLYSSDNQASGLINFGLTVISRALVDKASKIENRNGGTLLVVHKRTDSSVLFHSAKVTGSGQDTSVKGIGMVSLLMDWPCGDYSIHGATENVKPTVVNEKKATFVYKVPDVDYPYLDDNQEEQVYTVKGHDFSKGVNGSGGFMIFTPAY